MTKNVEPPTASVVRMEPDNLPSRKPKDRNATMPSKTSGMASSAVPAACRPNTTEVTAATSAAPARARILPAIPVPMPYRLMRVLPVCSPA